MIRESFAALWLGVLCLPYAMSAGATPPPTTDTDNRRSACYAVFASFSSDSAGPRDVSDVELIERSRGGDRDAADALIGRHWETTMVKLQAKLRFRPHDPEETIADVGGILYEKLRTAIANGSFFPDGDAEEFPGWLYRVAYNAAADVARKEASEARKKEEYACELKVDPNGGRESMDEWLDREQRHAWLRRVAAETLPARLQKVFELLVSQDLSADETAEILGVTTETVWSYKCRMLTALRERMLTTEGEIGR